MDLKSWPCWAKVVIAVGLTVFVFNFPNSSGDWAAWIQAVASVAAIVWAGHQGGVLLKRQKEMQQKAAIDLAVEVLRSVHGYLNELGEARWKNGVTLQNVAEGRNFFRVEYLDPVEAILDQVNLEHLEGSEAVAILVKARSKIWRIRELLTWVIVDVEKVQIYEKNGVSRFEQQSKELHRAVAGFGQCHTEMISCMKRYESMPDYDS